MPGFLKQLFVFVLLLSAVSYASCQKTDGVTTIIIVRHAEKDTGNNPPLSAVGILRAEKLSGKFPGVKPDLIYSSPYARTRQTATPWAEEAGVEIQSYDPRNLPEFADLLKKQAGKTILVIGHSNTNPQLVNLLTNEETYSNLPETDYETIYEVTIKKDKTKVKVIH
jgi:2,3-bisphosphoglycerate-dependent phosphoglycerate mutase